MILIAKQPQPGNTYVQRYIHLFLDFDFKKPARGRSSLIAGQKKRERGAEGKGRWEKQSCPQINGAAGCRRCRGKAGVGSGQESISERRRGRGHKRESLVTTEGARQALMIKVMNKLTYQRLPGGSTHQRWGWRAACHSGGPLSNKWWPCEWHICRHMTFSSKKQDCWRYGLQWGKWPKVQHKLPKAVAFSSSAADWVIQLFPCSHFSKWYRFGLNILPLI